ncbi:VOC family protein [Bacillus sp. SB49]|uniref:VOC family protein n=1 Tax=Bacillus sp. SB49 TaxID=1071080 RepID=UPI00041395E8|nr:VOC family protein [Bacillus sp. SB49]QHT47038.1 VOC family protein [Bacillus sp. SB49]
MEHHFFSNPAVHIDKVVLQVKDITRSLEFYTAVLGLKVQKKNPETVELSADGVHSILSIRTNNEIVPKDEHAAGLYHFAILLPERSDLGRLLAHLMKEGIQQGGADHLVSEALYFEDPDGNGIEVYHDRPSAKWSWKDGRVGMTTEPLDAGSLLSERHGHWSGMPEKARIGHIHLHVSNLDDARTFYVEGLGFQVVADSIPQALFLSDRGYHHHIGLNTWKGEGAPAPSSTSTGLRYFDLVLPGRSAVDETTERLHALGYRSTGKDTPMFLDPSGNRVRLVTN